MSRPKAGVFEGLARWGNAEEVGKQKRVKRVRSDRDARENTENAAIYPRKPLF